MSRFGLIGAASATAAGAEKDPFFENTTLLLRGDGNQGATNFNNPGPVRYLAFSDNSTNNFPITVNGDAYGDNFSPFSRDEGAWSAFFPVTSSSTQQQITGTLSSSFGTGNFTVEFWLNFVSAQSVAQILDMRSGGDGLLVQIYDNARLEVATSAGTVIAAASGTAITPNTWVHVAVVRSGTGSGQVALFINGLSVATGTSSTNLTSATVSIGSRFTSSGGIWNPLNGYLSNFRISNTNRTITLPTAPYTSDADTRLLTLQSNRFRDNSSSAIALTLGGTTPQINPFTPFTVTPNTTDGSGYFDGTGDFLTIPDSATLEPSSSNFTIECWIYPTATGSFLGVFSKRTNNSTGYSPVQVLINGGQMALYASTTGSSWAVSENASTNPPLNAWSHIAVVRNGTASNNLVLYLNGVSVATGSVSNTALSDNAGAWAIGADSDDGGGNFNGYISSFRYVKGTALYTSAFSPPSTPLTAVENTQLLTCQYQGTVRNVGFIDSSPYDHRITRVGNTTQGSFSPFSKPDGRWGNYFDGSGDWLSTTSVSASGTGDFTYEAWIYPVAFTNSLNVIFDHRSGGTHTSGMFMYVSNTGALGVYNVTVSTNTLTLHTWNHIAFVRSSGTLTYYINGVSGGSQSFTRNNTDTLFYIGNPNDGASGYSAPCYLSNVRYTKSAVYTSAFTPSTTPLTAIANTQLLTCQSNRFKDNSTNNFTITRNGDAKVTPFSPFPITTAYDPAVNGGSGYFDGSDQLSMPSDSAFAFGTGAYTIEAWVYLTQYTAFGAFVFDSGSATNSIALVVQGNGALDLNKFAGGSILQTSSGAVPINAWTHIAAVRTSTSSNATVLYVNGVALATGTDNNNWTVTTTPKIGGLNGSFDVFGYISNLRVVKGSAITPPSGGPTSLVTAISGTSLLTNFTNAGIFDNTGFNNLETVGNAQIDTSVKKYGTGAIKFDGTGDGLFRPPTQDFDFGTGNFTIEWWMYFTSKSGYQTIMSYGYTPDTSTGWLIQTGNGDGKIVFYKQTGGTTIASDTGSTVNTGEWYHIAVVRNSGTTTIYRNGTSVGSGADTNNYVAPTANFYLGGGSSTAFNNFYFNGFIDDLRITKGIARYTANFDPPTKAFPNIGE